MQKLFMTLLDVLFPPSQDMRVVRKLTSDDIRTLCHDQNKDGIISLSRYEHESVRALIHEAKFHGSRRAQRLLACLLNEFLNAHSDAYDIIVPIPLSPSRKRERGFNQVEEVLRETKTDLPLLTKVLSRTKNTPPQTSLEKAERLTNMKGAFRAKKPVLIAGKRILLIDDVTTTGATLRSAKSELMKHEPASVTVLALAH